MLQQACLPFPRSGASHKRSKRAPDAAFPGTASVIGRGQLTPRFWRALLGYPDRSEVICDRRHRIGHYHNLILILVVASKRIRAQRLELLYLAVNEDRPCQLRRSLWTASLLLPVQSDMDGRTKSRLILISLTVESRPQRDLPILT